MENKWGDSIEWEPDLNKNLLVKDTGTKGKKKTGDVVYKKNQK